MKKVLLAVAAVMMVPAATIADDRVPVKGDYVEARTAEVFAGGCIMNSEAETAGRQAVLAWRIASGRYNGVTLDGRTIVAAVAGNRNLGMREMGGEAPDAVRAVFTVDAEASDAERDALVALARELTGGLITEVARIDRGPIVFATSEQRIDVSADGIALSVIKGLTHDPSCGAMQWFKPFSRLDGSAMGLAETHAYSGTALGSRWSAPHKRSAFWGAFAY